MSSLPAEQFEGVVRNLSSKGYGVVEHPNGRVFFARGAWPLDHGLFEIEFSKQKYGQATLVKLLTPSPERLTPPCPYQGHSQGKCGGCPWMIAAYEHQLQYKQHRVLHSLERQRVHLSKDHHGHTIQKIWASPKNLAHRNRMQFKSDGEHLCLVSENSNHLVPIDDCLLMNSKLQGLFKELRDLLPKMTKPNCPSHGFIDLDDDMTSEDLKQLTLNKRRPFKQGNTEQNQRMREWISERVSRLHSPVLLELFAGQGNFTEVLARTSNAATKAIVAVEAHQGAIQKLREQSLPKVHCLAIDLFSPGVSRKLKQSVEALPINVKIKEIEAILVNPPRDGVKGMEALLRNFSKLKEVFYISCDPETFARDAKILQDVGFSLEELQPVDQFPHTPHIEILSRFSRS